MDRLTAILCVNAGSSTLKCARFEVADGACREVGRVEVPAGPDALGAALAELVTEPAAQPAVVAHRVVHGGPGLVDHCVVDEQVLGELRRAVPFAPLHLPAELDALDATARMVPTATQVACFDTTFHRTLPPVARRLPLPEVFDRAGIRRFGFHGLSCEYVVGAIGADVVPRAVIAHLGSGASLTAVAHGRSVDTSMGLTPTGGIVMATRTGDLDPGVLVHLSRAHGLDPDALEDLVNHRAGLVGLSGISADMPALLDARSQGVAAAALAVDAFCTSVGKQVGALATVLGGIDTLVFTGGIGEHSPLVRAEVCDRLAHLGIVLDPARNERSEPVISTGPVTVRVVATDENLVVARHAARLTGLAAG